MFCNAHYISLNKIKKVLFLLRGESTEERRRILGQISNRFSVISKYIISAVALPHKSHLTLVESNHGGNLALVPLGERRRELQTVFGIKENGIGAGIRGGQDSLECVSL